MGNNNSDFGAFLSGFVLGGLVGAAVALLLAPQSGEETRTYIRDKGIELKDYAETSATEIRTQAETKYAEAQEKASQYAQQAQTKAGELKQRGQVVLDEGKSKFEEQKAKVGDAISSRKKKDDAPAAEAEA
ncbi:MAG: YtxH domain-containing protein [Chloroflexota bacterium]